MPTVDYSKQWKREVNRIRRQEQRLTQKGFNVEKYDLKKPKKVTAKSVEKLKKITAERVYSRSTYTDPLTGKTYRGQKAKEAYEKARAAAVSYYEAVLAVLEKDMETAGIDKKTGIDLAEYYRNEMPQIKREFTKGGAGYAYMSMEKDGITFGAPEKYRLSYATAFISNLIDYCNATKKEYTKDLAATMGNENERETEIDWEIYDI